MIDDDDITEAAKVLILQHGDMAIVAAAQRIGELETSGDLEAVAVWRRIQKATLVLTEIETDPPIR